MLCARCFFFNPTAATEIYTLSLHDALPISRVKVSIRRWRPSRFTASRSGCAIRGCPADRKSTRLNSSHVKISYAVFCLKKRSCRIFVHSCLDGDSTTADYDKLRATPGGPTG